LFRVRKFFNLIFAAGLLLSACQSAPPATPKPAGAPKASPAAAQPSGPEATPALPVASPIVQLVQGATVTPGQAAAHVFLWGEPETTSRDLQLAKDAGFTWVKQRFEWRNIEKSKKDAFEWYEAERIVDAVNKAGLGLIVRLDNQPEWARRDQLFPKSGPPDKLEDWKDYVEAVAEHFKGKVAAYEIWNEPNINREWGDAAPNPQAYVDLLKISYTAIKKEDPNALVISAGLSPTTETSERAMPATAFLEGMYTAGAKDAFDMLGVHAPGFKAEPEADPATVARDPALTNNDPSPEEARRAYAFRHVEDMRAIMVKNGDSAKQVGIMEMGYTADPRDTSPYRWHSVTEEQKGEYLVRALQYARKNWSPWIGLMTVIYIASPQWKASDEQYYWSLTNPDGTPRPAYAALQAMPKP
jgi:polysaccharide biosynthesis protein PslG